MLKKIVGLCFIVMLCHESALYPVVVGSNSAVSRPTITTFPQVDTNNTMLGFAAFSSGFILGSYTTTCTYDDFFAIGTTANLNGGLLWLAKDLVLEQGVAITTVGTIAGTNKSLIITTTQDLIIPSGDPVSTLSLSFITSQAYAATVRSLDWTYDSKFVAVGAQTNDLRMFSFDGTTLTLRATQAVGVNLVSVRCHPTQNYVAIGTVSDAGGDEFRIYRFDPTTYTLTQVASNNYGNTVSSIAWHPSGNYVAIIRESPAPEITVFSFVSETLTTIATASLSPSSTLIFDVMTWNPLGNYLIVGTYGASTLELFYFSDPTLTLTLTNNIGINIAAAEWSPTDPYIAVGLASGTEMLRVYQHNVSNGTLTEITSARVGEATAAVQDISWKPDGSALTIARVAGTGTDFRAYSFSKSALTLSLIGGFDIAASVNTVSWSPNGAFIAEGDSTSQVGIYLAMTTGTNDELILTNLKTTMNSNIIMKKPLRFKGICAVNGKGNSLYLDVGSEIRVDQGATVLFENISIQNVYDGKMRCLDSLGTITLSNASLYLSDTYTFTQGSFLWTNDVLISGTPIFSYESAQQSTIAANSTLYFDSGTTFSYAPRSSSRTLFAMTNATSQLAFNGTTLLSTTTGLQLTKGTLIVDGACTIRSAATVAAEGIQLGDGTSVGELLVKILPEASIDVVSGFLVYNNVT